MTLKAYKLSVFYSTCHDIYTERTKYGGMLLQYEKWKGKPRNILT